MRALRKEVTEVFVDFLAWVGADGVIHPGYPVAAPNWIALARRAGRRDGRAVAWTLLRVVVLLRGASISSCGVGPVDAIFP